MGGLVFWADWSVLLVNVFIKPSEIFVAELNFVCQSNFFFACEQRPAIYG